MFQEKSINRAGFGGQAGVLSEPIIHTMRDDLQELKNPGKKKIVEEVEPVVPRKIEKIEKIITAPLKMERLVPKMAPPKPVEKQSSSPFLSDKKWGRKIEIEPTAQEREIKKPLTIQKSAGPRTFISPIQKQRSGLKKDRITELHNEHSHHGLGKVILVAFLIALFLLAGAGGYYYWMNRGNLGPIMDKFEFIYPREAAKVEESLPSFSENNPNNLPVDMNAANVDLNFVMVGHIAEVSEKKVVSPVAYVVKDSQNAPVTFPAFAKKIGLNLNPAVSNQLTDEFTLYIYNDKENTRIGLSVGVKSEEGLKTALDSTESELVTGLQPLFLDVPRSEKDTIFDSSTFNGITVRFININTPEDLTIDYAIYNNQWVIGTTKMTLRAILDRMSNVAPMEEPSKFNILRP